MARARIGADLGGEPKAGGWRGERHQGEVAGSSRDAPRLATRLQSTRAENENGRPARVSRCSVDTLPTIEKSDHFLSRVSSGIFRFAIALQIALLAHHFVQFRLCQEQLLAQ